MVRPEHLEAIAARGIALVPTLIIRDGVLEATARFGGTAAVRAMRAVLDAQPGMVRAAVERGIPVYAGTDAGMVPHGLVATEVDLLVAAGVPPDAALGAASWQARHFLGLPGITEGAPADLVAYAENPLTDSQALHRPRVVVLDGRPCVTGGD
jgi:imidazolonepropionase-like amidohydrolase